MITMADVTSKEFVFRYANGGVIASDIKLAPGGVMVGDWNENEDSWDIVDGKLVFRNNQGEVSTSFESFETVDGLLLFSGASVSEDSERSYVLSEVGLSRLVGVVKKSNSSRNLIVCFNSYANAAHGAPEMPFETRLEGVTMFGPADAHVVWFAEDSFGWYMSNEKRILDAVLAYIGEHDIQSVKLVGMSCGGYAALRYGLLLDWLIAERGGAVDILSFAVNPQTGFRPELLTAIRAEVAEKEWSAEDFGKNPILLQDRNHLPERCLRPEIDILDLAKALPPRRYAAALFYDGLNPIDNAFCQDLSSLEFVALLPMNLGKSHADGCRAIWKTEAFQEAFTSAMPFGDGQTETEPLVSLFQTSEPMMSAEVLERSEVRYLEEVEP